MFTASTVPAANSLYSRTLETLVMALSRLCRVEVIGPCAAVSLVGRSIRATLHRLGDALELFEEQRIYLVTQAANDLNITFVVDEEQGDRLVRRLHDVIVWNAPSDHVLGPDVGNRFMVSVRCCPPADRRGGRIAAKNCNASHTSTAARTYTTALRRNSRRSSCSASATRRSRLLRDTGQPAPGTAADLRGTRSSFNALLARRMRARAEGGARDRPVPDILFTPNFAPRSQYEWAIEQGVNLTIDNVYALREWGELFRNRYVLNPHRHRFRPWPPRSRPVPRACIRVARVPLFETDEVERLVQQVGARVVGLHAHTGSGVFDVRNWKEVGHMLAGLAQRFPQARAIDLGGGLGVPEKPGQVPVDLAALQGVIDDIRAKLAGRSVCGSSRVGTS